MNYASKQGAEEFKSKWVVPTEESRAELAEWGLRTREEQDKLYRTMANGFERVHRARLAMVELSRIAAEEALKTSSQFSDPDVMDAALVEDSKL